MSRVLSQTVYLSYKANNKACIHSIASSDRVCKIIWDILLLLIDSGGVKISIKMVQNLKKQIYKLVEGGLKSTMYT